MARAGNLLSGPGEGWRAAGKGRGILGQQRSAKLWLPLPRDDVMLLLSVVCAFVRDMKEVVWRETVVAIGCE